MANDIERIEMVLPSGQRLVLGCNLIYMDGGAEPAAIEPDSARAYLNGEPISVDEALAMVAKMAADAEERYASREVADRDV